LCPNAPKNLRSVDKDYCGASSFTLEWDAPPPNIGKPLKSYNVWYRDLCDDDSEYKIMTAQVRDTQTFISPPRTEGSGDRYRFYVEAVNSDCPSKPSDGFDFEFIQLPQPPELTVRETCGVVELGWNDVLSTVPGCSQINSYVISVRDLGAADSDFVLLGDYIDSRRTNYQLSSFGGDGFESGKRYAFMVGAASDKCQTRDSQPKTVEVAGSKGYVPDHVHLHYHHLTGQACLDWSHNQLAADSTTGF